jgi:hypothetical protein
MIVGLFKGIRRGIESQRRQFHSDWVIPAVYTQNPPIRQLSNWNVVESVVSYGFVKESNPSDSPTGSYTMKRLERLLAGDARYRLLKRLARYFATLPIDPRD